MRSPANPPSRSRFLAALALILTLIPSVSMAQEVTVLVAYHSQTGNTETMAAAVGEGAAGDDVAVVIKRIGEVTKDDLDGADAVAVGSPVHMGDVAVEVRQALVDWAYGLGFWRSRGLQNKPCAEALPPTARSSPC